LQLINGLFLPFKVQQITQIPVSNNQSKDIFTWGPDKNGFFSVKSAYNYLNLHTKLRKIKTIPRHIQLMWRILHGKLLVKIALLKRGINCQPICNLCDQNCESIDHIFFQCEWSKVLWFASPLAITTKFMPASISFVEWIKNIIKQGDNETNQLIMANFNEIWFVRNKRCFEGINAPDPVVSLRYAMLVVQQYNSSCEILMQVQNQGCPIPTSNVRLTVPPPVWYKLNTDAAGQNEDGTWGPSAIVRDSEGVAVAATCWRTPILPNSDMAEAMAMKKGMEFAKYMLFLKVIVESNSQNVISAVTNAQPPLSYMGTLVDDCRLLACHFQNLQFVHIRRGANQAAHYLAKYTSSHHEDVWIEDAPNYIDVVSVFDFISLHS